MSQVMFERFSSKEDLFGEQSPSMTDLLNTEGWIETEGATVRVSRTFEYSREYNPSANNALNMLCDRRTCLQSDDMAESYPFLRVSSQYFLCVRDAAYYHQGSHTGASFVAKHVSGNWTVLLETLVPRPLSVDKSYPTNPASAQITTITTGQETLLDSKSLARVSRIDQGLMIGVDPIKTLRAVGPCFVVSRYAKLYPWDRITGMLVRVLYLRELLGHEVFEKVTFVCDEFLSERDIAELARIGVKKLLKLEANTILMSEELYDLPNTDLNKLFISHAQEAALRKQYQPTNPSEKRGRVYLPRPRYPHWRSTLNHDEVLDVFVSRDFTIMDESYFSEMPLSSVVQKIYHAELVVSHFGSGMINTMFAQNKTLALAPMSAFATEHFLLPGCYSSAEFHIAFSTRDVRSGLEGQIQAHSFFDPHSLSRQIDQLLS